MDQPSLASYSPPHHPLHLDAESGLTLAARGMGIPSRKVHTIFPSKRCLLGV